MQRTSILSVVLILSILLTSITFMGGCTKENTQTTYNIQGLWVGTHQNSTSSAPINLSIKPDGTASYENVISGTQQFCSGTWSLSGTTFTCNTTCIYGLPANIGAKQTFTAVFNPADGTLTSGQWATTSPAPLVSSGTFSIVKVK